MTPSEFADLLQRCAPTDPAIRSQVVVTDHLEALYLSTSEGRSARVARSGGPFFGVIVGDEYERAFVEEDAEGAEFEQLVRDLVDIAVVYLRNGGTEEHTRILRKPYLRIDTSSGPVKVWPLQKKLRRVGIGAIDSSV